MHINDFLLNCILQIIIKFCNFIISLSIHIRSNEIGCTSLMTTSVFHMITVRYRFSNSLVIMLPLLVQSFKKKIQRTDFCIICSNLHTIHCSVVWQKSAVYNRNALQCTTIVFLAQSHHKSPHTPQFKNPPLNYAVKLNSSTSPRWHILTV